jgi:hypothetical protein
MATRFYFPLTEAAAVSPTISGTDWGHIEATPIRCRLLITTPDASTLTDVANAPDSADHIADVNSLHRQYVSDPLGAQQLSGTVKAQLQASELHVSNNLQLTIKIYVVDQAGTTQKETLLAITRRGTEATTAMRNTSFASIAIATVDIEVNDRIVVEVGLGGLPTSGGGTNRHNGSLRWGGTATGGDLAENETEAGTTFRPWIEFSDTITLPANVVEADGSSTGAAVVSAAGVALWFASGASTGAATVDGAAAWVLASSGASMGAAVVAADGQAAGPRIEALALAQGDSIVGVATSTIATTQALAIGQAGQGAATAGAYVNGYFHVDYWHVNYFSTAAAVYSMAASVIPADGSATGAAVVDAVPATVIAADGSSVGAAVVDAAGEDAAAGAVIEADGQSFGLAVVDATGAAIATTGAASTADTVVAGAAAAIIGADAAALGDATTGATSSAVAGVAAESTGLATVQSTSGAFALTTAEAVGAAVVNAAGGDGADLTLDAPPLALVITATATTLETAIPLVGSSNLSLVVTATTLETAISLVGASSLSLVVTAATLETAIPLIGSSSLSLVIATATLDTAIALVGASDLSLATAATLETAIALIGSSSLSLVAVATLTTGTEVPFISMGINQYPARDRSNTYTAPARRNTYSRSAANIRPRRGGAS